MRIAITDACIFIDLMETEIVQEFFQLPIEVHTSHDVLNELFPEQQQLLRAYALGSKLTLHALSTDDYAAIKELSLSKALSEADTTVVYLAKQLNAMAISSDKAVRSASKAHAVEYHGMIWIFDQLVEAKLIPTTTAAIKLVKLGNSNRVYLNNKELQGEIKKREEKWK